MRHLNAHLKTVNPDSGEFEAILSMPTLDRDKEVVDSGAFNPLPESIPIHVDHNMSVRSLVARGRPYYEGETLMVSGKFASSPDAQLVRQLAVEGILDSMSVGFLDAKRYTDEKGVPHIGRGELIEASFVTVPSNREALVMAAKNAGLTDDPAYVQALHDNAVASGAACKDAPAPEEDDTASDLPASDPSGPDTRSADPEDQAAAPAAADPLADVVTARVRAAVARAQVALLDE